MNFLAEATGTTNVSTISDVSSGFLASATSDIVGDGNNVTVIQNIYIGDQKKPKGASDEPIIDVEPQCEFMESYGDTSLYCYTYCSDCAEHGAVYNKGSLWNSLSFMDNPIGKTIWFPFALLLSPFGGMSRDTIIDSKEMVVVEEIKEVKEVKESIFDTVASTPIPTINQPQPQLLGEIEREKDIMEMLLNSSIFREDAKEEVFEHFLDNPKNKKYVA